MKGIDIKKGPSTVKKEFNLKGMIYSNNDNPLSKNELQELAIKISNDWLNKNKKKENLWKQSSNN